jgi:hypothetical protein
MTYTAAYSFIAFLTQTKLYLFYNSVHPDDIEKAITLVYTHRYYSL